MKVAIGVGGLMLLQVCAASALNSYGRGGSTVYGSNPNTESSWQNTHTRNGNQYGIDSRGNS